MTDATANRVQPYLDDGDLTFYHGDAITVLQSLPAGIAQTCVTSPPYWGLRDYGTGTWTGGNEACDHKTPPSFSKTTLGTASGGNAMSPEARARFAEGQRTPYAGRCPRCGAQRVDDQLGLEATPQEYVERLVSVFREVRRVLRDDGTLWLNLGDSLKAKDLVGIPWRVAFALQADGWYLRSDVIWSKPNPMPESVTDRPTKAHEYLFLFSKQPRYFYDADAIREDGKDWSRGGPGVGIETTEHYGAGNGGNAGLASIAQRYKDGTAQAGRNRRSVWTIPTEPFPEAHFATYPQELVRPCILAGTSERGECATCGAPWRRVTTAGEIDLSRPQARRAHDLYLASDLTAAHIDAIRSVGIADTGKALTTTNGAGHNDADVQRLADEARAVLGGYYREYLLTRPVTNGWQPSCTCDTAAAPQIVLDPFIGSGTTALVARKHGRRCIGIDLSAEYLALAAKRTQQLSLLGGAA